MLDLDFLYHHIVWRKDGDKVVIRDTKLAHCMFGKFIVFIYYFYRTNRFVFKANKTGFFLLCITMHHSEAELSKKEQNYFVTLCVVCVGTECEGENNL